MYNAKADYEDVLVESLTENPKKFYNYTRSFTRSSSTVEQLVVDGEKIYSDCKKADCLNDFFASVLTDEPPMHHSLPINTERCEDSMGFRPFTIEQIEQKMNKLKPNKSCGPDGIHINVLRMVPALAIPLCDIFNHSVFSGFVPHRNGEMEILLHCTKKDQDSLVLIIDQ